MVCDAYMRLDHLMIIRPDLFIAEQIEAYTQPLMIALQQIFLLDSFQLKRNLYWITPFLSDIVCCNDRTLRLCVKDVYEKQINKLLMSMN
jgi:hypothetical protein